jgi:hypothetical protein
MRNCYHNGVRATSRGLSRGISCWAAGAAAVVGLAVGPREVAGAETLRWKLKPGDVLRYSIDEKTVSTFKVMGREFKSKRSQTINQSWNVKSVSANGDAEVTLRYDRVRMHIEQPPYMPFDFDSSAADVDAPEPFGSLGKQIKAMGGAEITFRLKPSGAVEDVRIPEQTLKTLREGLGGGSAVQGTFSEQGLKEQVVQSSPPPLPDGSVEPGKSWAPKPLRVPFPPLGTAVVSKVFTFEGSDPKTPTLMRIALETKVALEPGENPAGPEAGAGAPPATITGQEGRGTFTFDADAGRITNSQSVQKLDVRAVGPGEQKIDQTMESTTTLTLQP